MTDIKKKVQAAWSADNTKTKAELARQFGTSPRSVGRYLQELNGNAPAPTVQKPVVTATTPSKAAKVIASGGFTAAAQKKLTTQAEDWKPEDDSDDQEQIVKPEPVAFKPAEVVEYRVLATSRSISITKLVEDKAVGSVVADKGSTLFEKVFADILASSMSQECLARSYLLLQPKEALKLLTKGRLTVDVEKGVIVCKNSDGTVQNVHSTLAKRILEALRNGGDLTEEISAMMCFLDNLLLNPSYRAVQELYDFLRANDIKLTSDGHFIAWKSVKGNYMDKRTGTMDNSPGKVVSMPRNEVDEDSSRTCSSGLHCCSKGYLRAYFSSGDRIVAVKVHPRDVVSIPADYDSQKMRCCQYTVVEDVTEELSPR